MSHNPFGPAGWTPDRLGPLVGKTYVITGASSGIGFEAARLLLSKGARVVMLNRDPGRSAAAISALQGEFGPEVPVSFVRMDLGSLACVRKAAAEILQKVPRIDALLCNAAVAQVARRKLTPDGFESQMGVNYFGHFLLCGLLFDRIEASGGRIVVVSSGAYKMGERRIRFEDLDFGRGYSAWNAYAQSKLALMVFAYELNRRAGARGKRVRAFVCHPGATRGTNLLRGEAGLPTRVLWAMLSRFAQPTHKGAWPEVMCATEDGLAPDGYYGPTRFEMVGPVGACPLEEFVLDRDVADRLWAISERRTAQPWSP